MLSTRSKAIKTNEETNKRYAQLAEQMLNNRMQSLLTQFQHLSKTNRSGFVYLTSSLFLRMMIQNYFLGTSKPIFVIDTPPAQNVIQQLRRLKYASVVVADPRFSEYLRDIFIHCPSKTVECTREDFQYLFEQKLGSICDAIVLDRLYKEAGHDIDAFVDLLFSIEKLVIKEPDVEGTAVAREKIRATASDIEFLHEYLPNPFSSSDKFSTSKQFGVLLQYLMRNRIQPGSVQNAQVLSELVMRYHRNQGEDVSQVTTQVEIDFLREIGVVYIIKGPDTDLFVWNPLSLAESQAWMNNLIQRASALSSKDDYDKLESLEFMFRTDETLFQVALRAYLLSRIRALLERTTENCESAKFRRKLMELRSFLRWENEPGKEAKNRWEILRRAMESSGILRSENDQDVFVESVAFEKILATATRRYARSKETLQSINHVNNLLQQLLGNIPGENDQLSFITINAVFDQTWYLHRHRMFPSESVIRDAEAKIRTYVFSSQTISLIAGLLCNIHSSIKFDETLLTQLPYAYELYEIETHLEEKITNDLGRLIDFYCRHADQPERFKNYSFLPFGFADFADKLNSHLLTSYPSYSIPFVTDLKHEILSLFDNGRDCRLLPNTEIEHVILIVVDAMGFRFLVNNLRESKSLEERFKSLQMKTNFRVQSISTVFPSTTGVAHLSLLCGCFPADHGIPADKYRKMVGDTITEVKVFGDPIEVTAKSIFVELKQRRIKRLVLSYAEGTGFGDWLKSQCDRYTKGEDIALVKINLRQIIQELQDYGRTFTFVQIGDLDRMGHGRLLKQRYVHVFFSQFLEAVHQVIADLETTELGQKVLFIITADHGVTFPSKKIKAWTEVRKSINIGNRAVVSYSNENISLSGVMRFQSEDLKRIKITSQDTQSAVLAPRSVYVLPSGWALNTKEPTHGGLSIDEMIVPLITFSVGRH